MRTSQLIFFILFLTPITLLSQAMKADSSNSGYISIFSKQNGLPTFLDGTEIGVTPIEYFPVAIGEHEIAVRRHYSESWMDADWVQHIEVAANDTLEYQAEFTLGYLINSTPFGAEVFVNGRRAGTTPYVLRLPEGEKTKITLSMEGYRSSHFEIGGYPAATDMFEFNRRFDIVLERDFDYGEQLEQENLRRASRKKLHRTLAYVTAGISLASGVSSILLKREADEAYDLYTVTGDPAARESHFDRAKRYDKYSGAAFIVFEVSFAVSMYNFLKSIR